MSKPLKVAIDIRDLRVAKTGTKTYLDEICKEFKKRNYTDVEFHYIDSIQPIYTGDKKILRWVEHLKFQIWKQVSLPLKAFFKRCDVIFCTDGFVPLLHLRYQTVPVFHDAFCFESPEQYGKLWLSIYKKTAIPAARRSAFVVVPTEYSKKQIIHYTQFPDDKLVVIPEGPKSLNHDEQLPVNEETLLKSFALTKSKYILHVGAFYKRKNIPALVQAFIKIKQTGNYPDIKLALAGPLPANEFDSDYNLLLKTIENCDFKNDIILTGYLDDDAIIALYKNAVLYVFPSINEGFGIPVLEGFKYNLPVLVANNTCLPEVGGDAILEFNPFNIDDITSKIIAVLDDRDLQKAMIKKGQDRLNLFSWQRAADVLISTFRTATKK